MVKLKILLFSAIFIHWEDIVEIYDDKAEDILVVPSWPNQVWYK